MIIRDAIINDLPRIVTIYNEAIMEGGLTADLDTYDVEEKLSWFENCSSSPYGIYVLEENAIVCAYFYFSPWRGGRRSLRKVAEVSFYLSKEMRGQGYGSIMLNAAVEKAKEKGFYHLLAILLDINIRSQRLLEKFGFEVVASLPSIANLAKKKCGQLIMLKVL